jgi:hypothetical protein
MKSSLRLSRRSLAALGSLFLAVSSSTALAGPPAIDTTPAAPEPNKFLQSFVSFDATNFFDTSFSDIPVSLSVTRYSGYGEFKFRLSPDWMLKLFTYGDLSLYNFRAFDQPFTGPMRNAYYANVDLTLAYTFAPGWAIVGGGRIRSAASTDASFGDSVTGGGILAIKKSFFNGGIDLTLGASYTTRLSRSGQVLPYLDFDVNVLPSFVKIPVNVLLLYNGGMLTYRVTDNLSLIALGQYDSRAYRLAASSSIPKGVWSEYGVLVGGGFGWTPNKKNWSLTVLGGYEVFRNVQTFANNGFKTSDLDVNPTPFIRLDFHASF